MAQVEKDTKKGIGKHLKTYLKQQEHIHKVKDILLKIRNKKGNKSIKDFYIIKGELLAALYAPPQQGEGGNQLTQP